MKGRCSQGIRRSCRWSDSQNVQPSGNSATSRMVTTAGSTRPQASLLSWASMPRLRSAPGSGRSGAESYPVEQLLHVGCRLVQRRPRGGLASESPVKLNLQNFRDLIVHRRHRAGHGILDDSAGDLRGNLELAPELVTLIQ